MTKKKEYKKILTCRVLLFNLDGILIDTLANRERHWSEWAQRHQLDVKQVLSAIQGQTTLETIHELVPTLPADLEARYLNDMQILDTRDVVAMPGALKLLEQLSPEQWTIVTSDPPLLAKARLRAAKLPQPRLLISSLDVKQGKPYPEGYLKGAALMHADPEECLIIEDSLTGLEAALAAHIPALAVGTTHAQADFKNAEIWVPSLALLKVVDSTEDDAIALAVSE
jgi:mannitol-1-/sugar-/sorbitol-6-phosphatase